MKGLKASAEPPWKSKDARSEGRVLVLDAGSVSVAPRRANLNLFA